MSKLIESPIEEQMLDAMRRVSWRKLVVVEGITFDHLKGIATADEKLQRVFVVPQLKVGPYRADFMIACYQTGIYPTVVCVECDGHDYHRATHAQMYRDMERDLWMERKLIRTLRFSGKQITRDSYSCALKAISAVTRESGHNRGFEHVGHPIIRAFDNAGDAA